MKAMLRRPLLYYLFGLAIILRLYSLLLRPLTADEFWTYFWIKNDLMTMVWASFADFRAPFYYFVALFWQKIWGDSIIGLRFISLGAGIITLYLVYKTAQRLGNQTSAVWAVAVGGIAGGWINDAAESRMYGLGTMISALVIYGSVAFIQTQKIKYLIIITLALILGIYTYHYLILTVLSVWVLALTRGQKLSRAFLISQLVVFLGTLPFWYFFVGSWKYLSGFHSFLSGNILKPFSLFVIPFIPTPFILLIAKEQMTSKLMMVMLAAVGLFFGIICLRELFKGWGLQARVFLAFSLLPVSILAIFSMAVRPVIGIRSLVMFSVPVVIIIAKVISESWRLRIISLAIMLTATYFYLANFELLKNDTKVYEYMRDRYQPGDLVLVETVYELLWLRYYDGISAKALTHTPYAQIVEKALDYTVIPVESISEDRIILLEDTTYGWGESKEMLLHQSYQLVKTLQSPSDRVYELTKKAK